jgi:hypothetical protein
MRRNEARVRQDFLATFFMIEGNCPLKSGCALPRNSRRGLKTLGRLFLRSSGNALFCRCRNMLRALHTMESLRHEVDVLVTHLFLI